mgnify:CR=1 FL=1
MKDSFDGSLPLSRARTLPASCYRDPAWSDSERRKVFGDSWLLAGRAAQVAKPLAESGHFPMDVIEMVSVGEEANNLEQVLIQIAEKMERYTQRRLDLAVRLLEPLLLVVMAAVILFVMVALLLPIFKSSQMM